MLKMTTFFSGSFLKTSEASFYKPPNTARTTRSAMVYPFEIHVLALFLRPG
jgi:hypothetical protein